MPTWGTGNLELIETKRLLGPPRPPRVVCQDHEVLLLGTPSPAGSGPVGPTLSFNSASASLPTSTGRATPANRQRIHPGGGAPRRPNDATKDLWEESPLLLRTVRIVRPESRLTTLVHGVVFLLHTGILDGPVRQPRPPRILVSVRRLPDRRKGGCRLRQRSVQEARPCPTRSSTRRRTAA